MAEQVTVKRIFISGAHGAGCSLIKSLATGVKIINPNIGTCHESWNHELTQNGDLIEFQHYHNTKSDILVWFKVNEKNLTHICQRIVVLDFMYADDPIWVKNDWSWTKEKHARIAGPDWPDYSNKITDYPQWCLDELCEVAYNRTKPWTIIDTRYHLVIDSDELFGNSPPDSLTAFFNSINCKLDFEFLSTWKNNIQQQYAANAHLFSWKPGWKLPNNWNPTQ